MPPRSMLEQPRAATTQKIQFEGKYYRRDIGARGHFLKPDMDKLSWGQKRHVSPETYFAELRKQEALIIEKLPSHVKDLILDALEDARPVDVTGENRYQYYKLQIEALPSDDRKLALDALEKFYYLSEDAFEYSLVRPSWAAHLRRLWRNEPALMWWGNADHPEKWRVRPVDSLARFLKDFGREVKLKKFF